MRFKKLIYLKSKPIFIGLLLFFKNNIAQVNLIPNPSFENYKSIPTRLDELDSCQNFYTVFGTVDYYNTFSPQNIGSNCGVRIPANLLGFQFARTGFAYIGMISFRKFPSGLGYPIFSNYFEMFGVKLKSKLLANHVYDFEMFYNQANLSQSVNNQLSVYFSANQYSIVTGAFSPTSQEWYNVNINNINPQINFDSTQFLNNDTLNWTSYKGCFIALGNEEFMTIGDFRDARFNKTQSTTNTYSPTMCIQSPASSDMTYLYIDDLSLYDLGYYSGKAAAKKDTVICNGVSYTIGNNLKDSASITWWPSAGLSCTNCLNPVASPTVTTKYYVQKTLGCISSKDSITLSVYTPSTSANAGKSATLCVNDKLQLGTNDVNAYSTYTWQPTQYLNCYYCPQPMATAQSNITYTLSRQECSSASSSTIDIYIDNCELLLPQGFSPNNDGINDDLLINLPFTKEAKLTVFNRWGNILFEQSSTTQGTNVKYPLSLQLNWDGKAQKGIMIEKGKIVPSGTYFYLIEATHNDGSKKVYKEFVQVVY